ncbi:MAG: tetratricopeptide repeat protein [Gammaproteobacteria bacterium]|nr:tetratricopeptide repeat protein [Gammaproteobacteria bacterium]
MSPQSSPIRKFNPGTGQSDGEVMDQFVVRDKELDIVLDVLRSNIDAPSCQSTLVIAPRGAGKTMLLARVAAELRANAEISPHLLPIRFMEESHEAYDIGEFWLEAIFHLILEIETASPETASELRRSHDDLSARWRSDLAPQALGVLLDAADRLNRQLVLLVENLQNLCRDADDRFGWALRSVLQGEPRIMLLGSATTHFRELRNASEPFFELFHFVVLKPLDATACLRLWRQVSGDGESERTIRPLEIFTGGSPRLLVMVAEFAVHHSLPKLMEGLVALVDNHTEYFRGRLEQLPPGERRTYVAMIDLWQPSSTGEIAQRARTDIRKVSTCIGRLRSKGLISEQGTGNRKRYVASERLYSIYYKLRRERDEAAVVRNLIRFMAAFYSSDELVEMSDDLMQGASESTAIYRGIARALRDVPSLIDPFERRILGSVAEAFRAGQHKVALRSCERLLAGETLPAAITCKLLLLKALCFNEAGDHEAELVVCDELIRHFDHDRTLAVQDTIAFAELNRSTTLGHVGDAAAAIEASDSVVRRHAQHQLPDTENRVAIALENKAVALRETEQFEALIETLDEIVTRFGAIKEQRFRTLVVTALVDRGAALDHIGDTPNAIEALQTTLRHHGDSTVPELQPALAAAHFNLGNAFKRLGDHGSAIKAYHALDRDFEGTQDEDVQHCVAQGLVNLGVLFGQDMDDTQRAINTYDRVIHRFGHAKEPRTRRQVAMALANRGTVQRQIGEHESALASWKEVTERFSPNPDQHTRDLVTTAQVHTATLFAATGAFEQSRRALEDTLQEFNETEDPRVRKELGRALTMLGAVEIDSNRPANALACSQRIEREFGDLDGQFVWLARCHATRAHLALADLDRARSEFDRAYQVLVPTARSIGGLIHMTSDALCFGLPAATIIDILAKDDAKADALGPLLVALRLEAGQEVRAPNEVMEVATDIRASWHAKKAGH